MSEKKEKKEGVLNLVLAKQLYGIGLPDREIAHCCGVSASTVLRWRHAHGLRPNPEMARATGPEEQLTIDAVAARTHGMTYGQYIAQKPALLEAERRRRKK